MAEEQRIISIDAETCVCPSCGGVLKFDIKKEKYLCSSCGFEGTVQAVTDSIKEYRFDDYAEREAKSVPFEGMAESHCQNCGASIIFDKTTIASTCPMCGSTQIATAKQRAGIPPEGIVTFKIDKKDAERRFSEWVKKLWFAPNALKKSFQAGNLHGTYVPFWTYDAKVVSSYKGQGGENRTVTDSKGNRSTVTDWYSVSGIVSEEFDDIQICASSKTRAHVVDEILPFNTIGNLKPYAPQYMSGFSAELYSVKADEGFNYAKEQMEERMEELAIADIRKHYDEARGVTLKSKYSQVTYKHVLLPVWTSAFAYGGKTYNYIINGETGKVSGQRPYSIPKIVAFVLVIIAIGVAIFMFVYNDDEDYGAIDTAQPVYAQYDGADDVNYIDIEGVAFEVVDEVNM